MRAAEREQLAPLRHLLLALDSCPGSVVNVDSPCQLLQRFHRKWNLCLYPPRNDLPPGRIYPAHRWYRQADVRWPGKYDPVDAVATNGVLTPGCRSGTGTYSVNSDCAGTLTIVVPGLSDLHLQFIVAQSGNTIHQVVTDAGIATTGEGERLHIPKK
jgi:hypothetical protein